MTLSCMSKMVKEDLEGLTADLRANPWKLLYRPKNEKIIK
jgi:hypothetical protein